MSRYDDEMDDRDLDIRKPSAMPGDPDSELSSGEIFLAILCSFIGCLMGLVFLIQGKPKAAKMIGLSILFLFAWSAVRALFSYSN